MNCLRGSKSASALSCSQQAANVKSEHKALKRAGEGNLGAADTLASHHLEIPHRSRSQNPSCVHKFSRARYHGTLAQ